MKEYFDPKFKRVHEDGVKCQLPGLAVFGFHPRRQPRQDPRYPFAFRVLHLHLFGNKIAQSCAIVLHHPLHESLEVNLGGPSKNLPSL